MSTQIEYDSLLFWVLFKRLTMRRRLISMLLMLGTAMATWAIPAQPGLWKKLKLANGQTIEVQLRGDEFMKFWQDKAGTNYTMSDKGLIHANMEQLQQRCKELRQSQGGPYLTKSGIQKVAANSQKVKKVSYKGNKRCLILLAQFANKKFSMDDPRGFFNRVANEEGFSEGLFKGSVKDYFHSQSNGQFNLTFDVVGPYTLSNYENYGGNDDNGNDKNPRGMVTAVCQNAADEGVDFSPYDWDGDGEVEMVFVIYAGRGEASGGDANTIWPHKYALSAPTRFGGKYVYVYACSNEMKTDTQVDGIGTICHEFSHCLGYPDVYDTEYAGFYGMGNWDLMCSGSYNGNSYCPAGYTAYEKWVAGWIDPVELTDKVSVTGMTTTAQGGEAYKFTNPGCSDEYYIIENRQQEGWDAALPGAGIIINHIDYDQHLWDINMPNTNDPAYNQYEHITIIPADNMKDDTNEAGDPWPYKGNNTLNTKSTPAATAHHQNLDGTNFMNISISDMAIADDKTASFNFTNYNQSSSQEGYLLHETFDKCQGTGGNEGGFVPPMLGHNFATATFSPDVEGWTSSYMKGGSQCGRFGTSSATSVDVETPSFELNGTATLSFKCAPLGNEELVLELSSENAEISNGRIVMPSGKWTDFTTTIQANGNVKLKFSTTHAFFLDEVNVVSTRTSIDNVQKDYNSHISPYTYIYNIQGQEVYKVKTNDFRLSDVPCHGVLLMKQGNTTRKIIK